MHQDAHCTHACTMVAYMHASMDACCKGGGVQPRARQHAKPAALHSLGCPLCLVVVSKVAAVTVAAPRGQERVAPAHVPVRACSAVQLGCLLVTLPAAVGS